LHDDAADKTHCCEMWSVIRLD